MRQYALQKNIYKTGRVVILCYLTKELVFKPIKLNVAFKYDFKCYSETNFGHMEYIFDLDRQYTSSLGENLKKVGYYRVYPLHAYKFNHSILKRSRCTCCICTVMPVVQRFDQIARNSEIIGLNKKSNIIQNSLNKLYPLAKT